MICLKSKFQINSAEWRKQKLCNCDNCKAHYKKLSLMKESNHNGKKIQFDN